jgi:hypothetical protein
MINKFLSIIIEGEGKREEGKREGEGLLNCCRWKSSGRCGPNNGGEVGGGGAWSRRQFPGTAVKARRMARFSGASTWRRSEATAWRRTQRMRRRACHGGGRGGGVDAGGYVMEK